MEAALTARTYGQLAALVADLPAGSGVPARRPRELMRIEVSGRVGSGNITARPPRRGFWAWLCREPRPYAAALPSGRP